LVTADEPREESSGDFRARRTDDDARTSIIRREPSGPLRKPAEDPPTTLSPASGRSSHPRHSAAEESEPETRMIGQAPLRIAAAPVAEAGEPGGATAMVAATLNVVNGWATAVIATDLITGWWKTDRLFCVGVGFLTAVCGATIITGAFQLLLRRRAGIYLTLVGAVLAVLIFAGIFVTGAHVAGLVRALPVLPAAAALFVLLPSTWRWTRRG
jgi:hypothetical protein